MEEQGLLMDRRFKKAAIIALWLVVSLLIIAIVSDIKEYRFIGGGVPVTNTISVSGEGEVFAVPDIATFSFSVVEERETATLAQEKAAEKINAILDFLDTAQVAEKDIKTTAYNVYPRYEFIQVVCITFPCPTQREFKGFEVRQTIIVKVRDTSAAGEILSGVGERGATDISGLSFTIEDEELLQSEAREMAIDNARAKAKELASQLGVRIVRVVSFSESGGFGVIRAFAVEERALGIGGIVPELPTGENKITSFVTVTYEIR